MCQIPSNTAKTSRSREWDTRTGGRGEKRKHQPAPAAGAEAQREFTFNLKLHRVFLTCEFYQKGKLAENCTHTMLKIFTLPIILFLAQLQCFTLLLFSTWLHKQSSWRLSASLKSTLIVALNSFFSGHDFPRSSRGKMVPSKGLED